MYTDIPMEKFLILLLFIIASQKANACYSSYHEIDKLVGFDESGKAIIFNGQLEVSEKGDIKDLKAQFRQNQYGGVTEDVSLRFSKTFAKSPITGITETLTKDINSNWLKKKPKTSWKKPKIVNKIKCQFKHTYKNKFSKEFDPETNKYVTSKALSAEGLYWIVEIKCPTKTGKYTTKTDWTFISAPKMGGEAIEASNEITLLASPNLNQLYFQQEFLKYDRENGDDHVEKWLHLFSVSDNLKKFITE